jgi:hypothetical protein
MEHLRMSICWAARPDGIIDKQKEGRPMAESTEPTKQEQERFERKIARLRATQEERARILAAGPPFDYEAWVREAGPAKAEELAEMEEFLREREAERQRGGENLLPERNYERDTST